MSKRSLGTPLSWIVLHHDIGDSLFDWKVEVFNTERQAIKFHEGHGGGGIMVIRGRFSLGLEPEEYKRYGFGSKLSEEEKKRLEPHDGMWRQRKRCVSLPRE